MQATRKAPVRFRERSRTARFPAGSVGGHGADARPRPAAGQRGGDRAERAALRPVRHPAVQREAPATCASATRVGHREEVVRNLSVALGEGITGTAAAQPRAGAGGRRAQRSALPEYGGCGAHRTGRAHDGARQTGGRDRPAIHARQRVYRIRPRAAAPDRGARGHRHRQRAALPARGAAEPHAARRWPTFRASSPRSSI